MKEYKYINTGNPVELGELIISGDIVDGNIITIFDENCCHVCSGCWYEDRILKYMHLRGKATVPPESYSIAFRKVID